MHMKSGRSYVMRERALSTEATGERILDAVVALFPDRPYAQLTLAAVAERAGVSVQTVVRRFGDKDGLVAAAAARESATIHEQRDAAVPGDLDGIVDTLVAHYDAQGRLALRLLADEASAPAVAALTRAGRAYHRDWCRRVFEPWLTATTGVDRRRLLAQLVATCDVHTWQLLHLQEGLSRAQTRRALRELLAPLTTGRSR